MLEHELFDTAISGLRDLTGEERTKKVLKVALRFLEITNRHSEMKPLLEEFITEVEYLTGCQAIGIRILDEDGNIPYAAYKGFSRSFFERESPLSVKSDHCMCIDVVKGTTNPQLPFYTEGGSFYINATTRFLATVSKEDKGQTRNECNRVGYESVALVPIRLANRILGLIHLADTEENKVPRDIVQILEEAARGLGTALARVRAETALHESETGLRLLTSRLEDLVAERTKDLTRAKNDAEQKAAELDATISSIADGVLIFGPDQQLVRVNSVAADILNLGYGGRESLNIEQKATSLGIHAVDGKSIPIDDLPIMLAFQGKTTRNKVLGFYPESDRKPRYGSFSAAPIQTSEGRLLGAIATFTDITERRQAEEALRESDRRFRDILETIDLVSVMLDLKGNVTFCNESLLEMTGCKRQDVLGANWFDMFIPEESRSRMKSGYLSRIHEADVPIHYENEILTRGGARRLVVWNNTILRNPGGKVTGMASLCNDVTEHRNLEAQLRQAQKMEALGTLAGGIAHDFNNILGAAIGYTELALLDTPEKAPQQAYLQQVLKATDRAKELVKQILAFSRQSEQERKPLQISLIVKEALKLLRASLPATIEIQQEIKTTGILLGDPTQIHQVLMNLCTNSSHAMRDKGGILKVGLADVDLDVEAIPSDPDVKPGPYVRLTVSDTGHGIAPSIMVRVFDPFFTTKAPGEGTGMGLAVVHGIVKNHGGFIDVKSEAGKGTTFQVFFPRLKKAPVQTTEGAMILPKGTERILFVDDEPTLAILGKQMLERLGYRVVFKTSSTDALETFRNQPAEEAFDLVITDLTMPHMTGAELAMEILRLRPGLPIILCSGFSEAITPEKAQQMGIRAYITKPLRQRQLAELVRKILDERQAIGAL